MMAPRRERGYVSVGVVRSVKGRRVVHRNKGLNGRLITNQKNNPLPTGLTTKH